MSHDTAEGIVLSYHQLKYNKWRKKKSNIRCVGAHSSEQTKIKFRNNEHVSTASNAHDTR